MVQTLQSGVWSGGFDTDISLYLFYAYCFFPSGLATQAGIPKPKIVKEVNQDADLESNFMQVDSLTWLPWRIM